MNLDQNQWNIALQQALWQERCRTQMTTFTSCPSNSSSGIIVNSKGATGSSVTTTAAGEEDFHAEVAERGVTGRRLHGLARRWCRLVDRSERILPRLA
jgi:hypothetical protein